MVNSKDSKKTDVTVSKCKESMGTRSEVRWRGKGRKTVLHLVGSRSRI